MTPLIAFHKDATGNILTAGDFGYSFQIEKWFSTLDVRPGDRIEFAAKAQRPAQIDSIAPVEAAPEAEAA